MGEERTRKKKIIIIIMREKKKEIGCENVEHVRGKVKRGHTCFIKKVFFF